MNLNNSIEIKATREKIWNILTDPKQTPLWIKEEIKFVSLSELPFKKGFRFIVYIYRPVITLTYHGEVLQWEQYEMIRLLLKGGIFKDSDLSIRFQLTAADKKIRLWYELKMEEKGLRSLITPLTTTVGIFEASKYFTNLKDLAEKS